MLQTTADLVRHTAHNAAYRAGSAPVAVAEQLFNAGLVLPGVSYTNPYVDGKELVGYTVPIGGKGTAFYLKIERGAWAYYARCLKEI